MDCFSCDGELLNTETIFAKEYDAKAIVIKKVPVLKCEICGEEYFKPEENDNILKIISEVLNDDTQDNDVIVDYKKIVDTSS